MKTIQTWAGFTAILLGIVAGRVLAEETATVKENRVNVRGQASLLGEVITQLQKGEQVVVLEEIVLPKQKTDEPAKWTRIRMPANTPVWVHAPFIDPANKSVHVSRVNLRAGPGENYSVVGRLERGELVKDIRTVENWMEIETPPTAYAFVASEFLVRTPTSTPPQVVQTPTSPPPAEVKTAAAVPPPEPKAEKPVAATPPPTKEPEPEKTKEIPTTVVQTQPAENPPAVAVDLPPPVPKPETSQPAPAVETPKPAPSEPAPEKSAPVAAPTVAPAPAPPPVEVITPAPAETGPPPKRIVRREGIVRTTKSIQAPTYFELVHPQTRKVINYLHADEPNLKLKDFRGKKIVVTGEEGIDPRWPNTPLIEIQTLDLAP